MKRALSLVLLAGCSSQVLAADFGVGVSVQSNDAWIYAPIDVTPAFRIEPSIRFVSSESESQVQTASFGSPVTTAVKSDTDQLELAVGLFGKTSLGESVRLYYGARAAYIDSDTKQRIATSFGTFEDVSEEESSLDGYRISPTLGFEYLINEHFSLGGEAEWFYQDLDSDISQTEVSGTAKFKSNGTATRLILRFMF
jgi:outer membrane autotransporter protein